MEQLFNNEVISLLAVFVTLMATVVLVLIGRQALTRSKEARLAALNEVLDSQRNLLRDTGELTATAETLRGEVKGLRDLSSALQNDLEPLRKKHADAVANYQGENAKLQDLRAQWNSMQDKVNLFEKRIKQIAELEEEVSKLVKREAELKESIQNLPQVIEQLEKAQKELAEATKAYEVLKQEMEEAKLKAEALSSEVKEKEERSGDLDKLIKEKDEELKEKERQLRDVKIKLDIQKQKVGKIPEDAFESLYRPWLDINNVPQPLPQVDEMESLGRLKRLVTDSGFKLSERLQNAFHTALKTSDISCLTVMAGVSGTGKSAFPKLYAQAMGIHFLPLAVEPRWDSPQDLFGFLNYMENRYEATTLGRALVQFEHSDHASDSATMGNQVLMVLLDEMNLARIEYYFSEFLSKLEMRRNANCSKIEDYNNVSMEIYAGHAEDKENEVGACRAIRLFAGKNILFVGTMNEDESTQSLSDKVIDRANVLHFGKPDKLSNITQNVSNQSVPPISFSAWDNWISEPDHHTIPDLQNVEQQLNNMNAVLGDLGRPFGWRTYKAMLTYIANYPDKAHQKRAMADQVAMRIMPKLRGVDVSEHSEVFNRLDSLVANLNDPALNKAFDDARKSSLGFFNWRGINWDI